jgi:hypothetical protein
MLYYVFRLKFREEEMEKKVGEVTHFFAGPSAAVLKLSEPLQLGQKLHIVGATTDFTETLTSMQIDHAAVDSASPGDDIAILVKDRVREGDEVFVVTADAKAAAAKPAKAPAKKKAKTKKKAKSKAKPKPKAKAKAKKKTTKKKSRPKAKSKPKAKAKKTRR